MAIRLPLRLVGTLFLILYVVRGEPFFRKDYTYLNETDSFYKLGSSLASWVNAKKQCALEGATLVVLEDKQEATVVRDLWQRTRKDPPWLWVGLSDLISEGNFITVDGRLIDEVYNGWGPGQPDDNQNNEDCVILRVDTDLNDCPCPDRYQYMCKKTHISLEWNILCDIPDINYKYNNDVGKCYKFHQRPKSWNEAHATCNAEQSYLAIINSAKEKEIILKLMSDAQKVNHKGNITPGLVHMGFHNRDGDGWSSVKGLTLDNTGYEVWADNQPEHYADPNYCGAINPKGELHEIGCNKLAVFLCEHDIEKLGSSFDEKFGG